LRKQNPKNINMDIQKIYFITKFPVCFQKQHLKKKKNMAFSSGTSHISFSNPYSLLCSTLVDNIGDEEVALPGIGGKLGYGRVLGNLGHILGPACGS
jgi:hypothetical protein